MDDIDHIARGIVDAINDLIEADLHALGVTEKNAAEYTIIWQQKLDLDGLSVREHYRGIAHKGKLVWDKHPDWPAVKL